MAMRGVLLGLRPSRPPPEPVLRSAPTFSPETSCLRLADQLAQAFDGVQRSAPSGGLGGDEINPALRQR